MSPADSSAHCPSCGIPFEQGAHDTCPKCDYPVRGLRLRGILEVDVVHSGEDWEVARQKIEKAVDEAIHRGHAGVKIVHGYGSTSGHSVIASRAISLMKGLAERTDGRFTTDRNNPGAHLIWLNR